MSNKVSETSKRQLVAIVVTVAIFLVTYFINYLLPCINITQERWTIAYQFPAVGPPIGNDFYYVYQSAADWLHHGKSPYASVAWYPPIVFLATMPLTLLPYYSAYLIYTLSLIAAHLFCLFMAGVMIHKVCKPRHLALQSSMGLVGLLAALVGWQFFSGYAFSFSLERGSNDIIALAFVMIGVWFLYDDQESPWWATLAFFIAIFIKIYPLIFLVALFWRYRRRAILPTTTFGIVLTCITGPLNAWYWCKGVFLASAMNHYMWVGNHSGVSFFRTLFKDLWHQHPSWGWGFLLLPLFFWGLSALLLRQQARHSLNRNLTWTLFFLISFPPMLLVPTISHDHKLVILAPFVVVLGTLLLINFVEFGERLALLQLSLLLVLLAIINRSPYEFTNIYLANKYPLIICMQLLLIMIMAEPKGILAYSRQLDNN